MFAQTQTPVLPPHPPTPSLKSLHLLKNSETRILTVQGALNGYCLGGCHSQHFLWPISDKTGLLDTER